MMGAIYLIIFLASLSYVEGTSCEKCIENGGNFFIFQNVTWICDQLTSFETSRILSYHPSIQSCKKATKIITSRGSNIQIEEFMNGESSSFKHSDNNRRTMSRSQNYPSSSSQKMSMTTTITRPPTTISTTSPVLKNPPATINRPPATITTTSPVLKNSPATITRPPATITTTSPVVKNPPATITRPPATITTSPLIITSKSRPTKDPPWTPDTTTMTPPASMPRTMTTTTNTPFNIIIINKNSQKMDTMDNFVDESLEKTASRSSLFVKIIPAPPSTKGLERKIFRKMCKTAQLINFFGKKVNLNIDPRWNFERPIQSRSQSCRVNPQKLYQINARKVQGRRRLTDLVQSHICQSVEGAQKLYDLDHKKFSYLKSYIENSPIYNKPLKCMWLLQKFKRMKHLT